MGRLLNKKIYKFFWLFIIYWFLMIDLFGFLGLNGCIFFVICGLYVIRVINDWFVLVVGIIIEVVVVLVGLGGWYFVWI